MIFDNNIIRNSDSEYIKRGKCKKLFNIIKKLCITEQQEDKTFSKTDPSFDCSYKIYQFNMFCIKYDMKESKNDFLYKSKT